MRVVRIANGNEENRERMRRDENNETFSNLTTTGHDEDKMTTIASRLVVIISLRMTSINDAIAPLRGYVVDTRHTTQYDLDKAAWQETAPKKRRSVEKMGN